MSCVAEGIPTKSKNHMVLWGLRVVVDVTFTLFSYIKIKIIVLCDGTKGGILTFIYMFWEIYSIFMSLFIPHKQHRFIWSYLRDCPKEAYVMDLTYRVHSLFIPHKKTINAINISVWLLSKSSHPFIFLIVFYNHINIGRGSSL